MLEHSLLTAIVIFVAFFGESMFGFGGGLIAIPLLSILFGVAEAVTLVLAFQLCMGLLIWKTYKNVLWPVVLPMTGALIAGTVAGTLVLSISNPNSLRFILAALIIVFLIKNWFFSKVARARKTNILIGNIAGLGGGLFQGLIGTGGPPMTMYLATVIKDKAAMRASLIYLLFITSLVRVAISVPERLFTGGIIQTTFFVLPFFLIAIGLGQIMHNKVSEGYYRQTINFLLFLSAIILFAKSL
jgi:hypothetical protein